MLDANENAADLVAMHAQPALDREHVNRADESPGATIRIM